MHRKSDTAGLSDRVSHDFDGGAPRYDLLIALNPGYHKHLRQAAQALADGAQYRKVIGPNPRFVDLGCGSGASTKAILSVAPDDGEILGVDASAGMLAQANAKDWPSRVNFRQGRAGQLKHLARGLDGILACYLIRNVPEPERDAAFVDAFDSLAEDGMFVLEEYSVTGNRLAQLVWHVICWLVVIPLSALTGANPRLYYYLWKSVVDNESIPNLMRRMDRAGFTDIATVTVPGWQRNILHIVKGRKPETVRGSSADHGLSR